MRPQRSAVIVRLGTGESSAGSTKPTVRSAIGRQSVPVRAGVLRPNPVWALAAVVLLTVGAAASSPFVAVGGPAATMLGRVVVGRTRRRRNDRQQDRQVIDLVDGLGQHVRAGISLASGIERALADSAEKSAGRTGGMPLAFTARFDPARRALVSGETMPAALDRVDSEGLASLDLLVAALMVLLRSGGPVAVALDRIGETLRAGVGARDEAAAQFGQAVASAGLLAVLPFAFAAIVAIVEPAVADFYLSTWGGAWCLLAAGALSAMSWFWIDWAVHR